MSATRPSRDTSGRPAAPQAPRDITTLQARRREANRRRRLLRVDVGVGVIGALVLLIATPGLAVAAIFAGVLLALCGGSLLVQRRRARRRADASGPRRAPEAHAAPRQREASAGGGAQGREPV